MGICSSSNDHIIKEEENENADFEKPREEINDKHDEFLYEVKAKLYEFIKVNPRLTRKVLISKYLFFSPSGKFYSNVSIRNMSDLLIEGKLNPKTFEITLSTKQKLLENNSYRIKHYSGKLLFSDKECFVKGKITEDNQSSGKKKLENCYFELDFTTKLWKAEYAGAGNRFIQAVSYIRFKDLCYSGVFLDQRGISLIKGTLSEDNKCNMTLLLIDPSVDEQEGTNEGNRRIESNIYKIEGHVSDKKIEGIIKGKDIPQDSVISLSFVGNPRKLLDNKA